jgi:hypothetical protein
MAETKRPAASPFAAFLDGTREVFSGFGSSAARLAGDAESTAIAEGLGAAIDEIFDGLNATLVRQYEAASDEVKGAVDAAVSLMAGKTLVTNVGRTAGSLASASALAGVGSVLPTIKKIIRFLAEILGAQVPVVIDKLLELIDELAGNQAEQVSPKAAEQMHRAEVRYLEAQYRLDKLVSVREGGGDDTNGD